MFLQQISKLSRKIENYYYSYYNCNFCQMARLVGDDGEATVTQITSHYNQGMLKSIAACKTHQSTWTTAELDHNRCHYCQQLRTEATIWMKSPKFENRRL